jgi:alanine dehydrogenase
MLIAIPKEIKNHEYRVGATPSGVREMILAGNQVLIEDNAGNGIGFSNEEYLNAGAKIAKNAAEIYDAANMILKVKEPQMSECQMIRENQIIFSYLHLAAEPQLTEMLIQSKSIAIAFETVTANDGSLPLLAPMSEVAGKLSVQSGAKALEKANGGRGVLLGGVPGTSRAKVTIIGGGVAGTNAAKIAIGMGADVTILDKSLARMRYLSDIFGNKCNILYANIATIEKHIIKSDLVIGAVLIPGAAAPKLVTREMIDQGGCFETSKPTSHSDPIYDIDGVIHYCVTNMPGAVARTSTEALENATLPFTLEIAAKGYKKAINNNHHLKNGVNVIDGKVTYKAVSDALGYEYHNI